MVVSEAQGFSRPACDPPLVVVITLGDRVRSLCLANLCVCAVVLPRL